MGEPMSLATLSLATLSQAELAVLVPEYLLCGHLIDRAGMPHLISEFGRDGMRDVAIDEWMGASPVYTGRMQRALRFEGDSVETIFKGIQLDIGAPPQFMDFRYRLDDHDHGEFWLDHCGALMDVEPMGDDYVVAMCHDIEDPTFDATAIATNPRAQVRPVHRPPRSPTDQHPHCRWTVIIDEAYPPLPVPEAARSIGATRAAGVALADPDPGDPGRGDYSGPMLADIRFDEWSRSALVRIAEEVCLQGHLLVLSFLAAVRARASSEERAIELGRHQFTGIAGLAAERIRRRLDLGTDLDGVAAMLALHPALLPHAYVGAEIERSAGQGDAGTLTLTLDRCSDAMADGAWPALLSPDDVAPLDAAVRAMDNRYRCEVVSATDAELVMEVLLGDEPEKESDDVALARFSTGAAFEFSDRGTPVELRPTWEGGSVRGGAGRSRG